MELRIRSRHHSKARSRIMLWDHSEFKNVQKSVCEKSHLYIFIFYSFVQSGGNGNCFLLPWLVQKIHHFSTWKKRTFQNDWTPMPDVWCDLRRPVTWSVSPSVWPAAGWGRLPPALRRQLWPLSSPHSVTTRDGLGPQREHLHDVKTPQTGLFIVQRDGC